MIIDGHTHLFKRFAYLEGLVPTDLVSHLRAGGADAAVVFTFDGFFGPYVDCNNALARAASEFEGVLYPFCTVNPRDGERAVAEMRRCVRDLGMKGMKLHPWLQGFSCTDALVLPIMEEATGLGIPVVFHDGTPPYCTTLQIAHLAKQFPTAKIILGHAGLRYFAREVVVAAHRYPNLIICFCSTPWGDVKYIAGEVAAERLIFGSDLPFCGIEWLTNGIRAIEKLDIGQTEKELILGGNLERLLGA
jgi:predicted TIM-barrel fold metal-dependent hydrolase